MKHVKGTYASQGTGFSEKRDCSVRAAATASGLPYEQVHAVFTKHGRKPKRGTPTAVSIDAHKEMFKSEPQRGERVTVAEFVRRNPIGRYVLHVRGHALAVVDGAVHDWSYGPRRRVRRYWWIPETETPANDINEKIIAALEEQKRLLTILAKA